MVSHEHVWIVTNWQAIQWMKNPTPLNKLNDFEPWMCKDTVRINFPVLTVSKCYIQINDLFLSSSNRKKLPAICQRLVNYIVESFMEKGFCTLVANALISIHGLEMSLVSNESNKQNRLNAEDIFQGVLN